MMRRSGTKSARPADHGTVETERAAALARLDEYWAGRAAAITEALGAQKSSPDVEAALNYDAEVRALVPVLTALMLRLAAVGAWDVLAEWNPDSDGWSVEAMDAWIVKAAETNAGAYVSSVQTGLADAASDPATAWDRSTEFLESNALLIALATAYLTEAYGFGGWDAAKASGLRTKTWHTTSKNPRPSHAAQNGETVNVDDIFSNGLRWPGDRFGSAEDKANCACSMTYGKGSV